MGEKMTLGKVRDDLREWEAQSHKDRFDYPENKVAPCEEDYSNWADAIDAHLATPAQTVDVEAVKTLLELVEGEHGGDHTEADCRHCVAFNKLAQAIGDKT